MHVATELAVALMMVTLSKATGEVVLTVIEAPATFRIMVPLLNVIPLLTVKAEVKVNVLPPKSSLEPAVALVNSVGRSLAPVRVIVPTGVGRGRFIGDATVAIFF
jgi:hypothetical protein